MYREGFRLAWEQFIANDSVPIYDPLQTGFSQGRKSGLALAIRLVPEQIPQGMHQVVEKLGRLQSIQLLPPEYYHISVKLLGFLADKAAKADDIGPNELVALRNQTAPVLERATPFAVHLGSINVLGSYLVLEADDAGYIPSLQTALHEEAPGIPSYNLEGKHWLPHLSLGAFRIGSISAADKHHLAQLREISGGIIQVDRIELIQAELQQPFPEFHVLETFPLAPDNTE